MSNEENMFDFLSEDSSTDDAPAEKEASTEQEETKEAADTSVDSTEDKAPKKKEPVNEFDYSDTIDQMQADADISDDDSESDAEEGEKDSAEDSKDASAEKDSGQQSSEPTMEQLFQAAQLGLNATDVKGLSERELATAIRIAEKSKPADQSTDETEQKEEEALFTPIKLDGMEDFDEDTQSVIKGLQDQFNSNMEKMAEKLKSTQESLGQSQEATQQQGQAQFFEWFDKTVGDLGEGWTDVFGDDPNKLGRNTPEVQNRVKLIEEMDRLAISHPEFDKTKLFESAMQLTFSDEMKSKQEQGRKNTRNKHRQDRTTMKPTQRNRSIENMPDGREKALASVKELGKKKKFFGLF